MPDSADAVHNSASASHKITTELLYLFTKLSCAPDKPVQVRPEYMCRRTTMKRLLVCVAVFALVIVAFATRPVLSNSDEAAVAALDIKYQAAVKANDVAIMDGILADDFILVTGKGVTYNKADLLKAAREKSTTYEHQEDTKQTVRVWGNTAVVTALLWIKGTSGETPLDYKLWFSDTYVRTPTGWRYVFGQASIPLPKDSQ
jgi:ketosteroid isomerase-like protein